ncbi:50S ribosomal protein L10 [Candidatus Gottesmanbacteria bacterium RBG_16_43_7]|uniref:Large ribosomal subunit protein uL10 n=1 Tax=Candidatus Gottesmanbacteria bacterium RBG_16_43_7 TaxID=1798373 RepID=A0A1F5ZBI8_9BACT|nr:MAG: 50S ribosomal protein L10 [Candidatus Gottesmanbacteria bacterium RBG_16_43_7]
MPTQKKIDYVTKFTQKIKTAKSIVFADYRGLKHKQLEELRRTLKNADAEFIITKNSLMKRALGEQATKAESMLTHTTATLFSNQDEVAGVKVLLKFFKTSGIGSPKGGFLSGTFLTAQDVDKLAGIPTKAQLLANLAGNLQSPIRGLQYALTWNINKLVWALSSIKNKKTN